jgi:hypothetical protein
LATLRSEYRVTVTVIVLIPLTYLVLVVAGVDSGTAGMWALGFAAGVSAIALTRFARTSSAPTLPDDVNQRRPLRDALDTMLGLPVGVLLAFGLGVWSSRRLAGPHPMVWLAAIALSSRAVRLLLYWPAVKYARPRNVVIHGWEYILVRNMMLAVLIFCLLALGNRYGDRRNANNRP